MLRDFNIFVIFSPEKNFIKKQTWSCTIEEKFVPLHRLMHNINYY